MIFYKADVRGEVDVLSAEESMHCVRVLRSRKQDSIRVFDGRGRIYQAVLIGVSESRCEFRVMGVSKVPPLDFAVHLAVAPTKNFGRMEWLVEKLGEIGVSELSFIETSRSERGEVRMDRLEKKAISAMKQSGNPYLLRIHDMVSMEEFIEMSDSDVNLVAHASSHSHMNTLLPPKAFVSILIGPEGGFSHGEVEMAFTQGVLPISLSRNTLRTETAGLLACYMVQVINSL